MILKCKKCDCQEFVTKPNRYDVYGVVDGETVLLHSDFIPGQPELFCRECSQRMEVQPHEFPL